MKFKLDENLPRTLADFLRSTGHEPHTVMEENLSGSRDEVVLEAAKNEERIFLSFDSDFANLRKYSPSSHAGIVVFRLHDQRWEKLKPLVEQLLQSDVCDRLSHGIAIVDEARIRLRTNPTKLRQH